MANTLKPKRSSVAGNIPTTTNLTSGEMGVNMADQKIWINNGTSVVQIGSGKLSGLADVVLSSLATGQGLSWNGTNWVNSSAGSGTVTSVSGTGTVSGLTLSGSVTGSGSLTLSGAITGFLPLTGGTLSGAFLDFSNSNPSLRITSGPGTFNIGDDDIVNLASGALVATPSSRATSGVAILSTFAYGVSQGDNKTHFGYNTGSSYVNYIRGAATYFDSGTVQIAGSQVLHAGNFSSYAPSLSSTYADPAWITSLASSKLTGTIDNARLNGGTYTINVTGNAGTATALQTARTINGVSFNGTANITVADGTKLPLSGGTMSGVITTVSSGTAINFSGQSDSFGYNATAGLGTYIKGTGSTYLYGGGSFFDGSSQRALLHAGNFNSYSPTLTGGGASGTWGINITGNAATATTLQTARTINNVSFNGSANITIPRLLAIDDRTAAPADGNAGYVTFGFGSWNNNNTAPYADFMMMRSYTDSSGGNDNMVAFRKDAVGMRLWQGGFGSATAFGTVVDVLHSGNYTSYSPTLTGSGASGTWGINVTGSASNISNTGTVTLASAGESNSIFITAPSYTIDTPVKLLNFDWYGNLWSLGNIRSGSVDSNGFGVYYTTSAGSRSEIARFGKAGNLRLASGLQQGNNLARPLAEWSASGNSTGMVYIELPGANPGNYGMIHAVIDVYEYNANAAATIIIGGHNWNGSWYNVSANVIGATNKQVRLAVRNGKFVICLGDASSVWEYGTVMLRKIHNGSFYNNIIDMGAQFVIAQTTSEGLSGSSGDIRALRTPASFNAGGAITQAGNQVLHAGNYGSYSTFTGAVTSAGNNGFRNDVYYGGVRNPIWSFGNAGAYGISYFQGSSGIGGIDTFGVSVNGSTSATGVNFAVTSSASYVNNNIVLHAGNISSYAISSSGGTITGNNFIDFGPNSGWGATLRVGGNGHGGATRASVATTNGNLHLDGTTNSGVYLNWYNSGTAGAFFGNGAGGQVGRVDGGGNATFSGNVSGASDERLKTDWEVLPADYIERLAKVKSGTYTRLDSGARQAGASAQDMQKLLKETVMTADDEAGTLSLAYGNAALVSAIELAKDNVDLRARVAKLEALVSKLIEG